VRTVGTCTWRAALICAASACDEAAPPYRASLDAGPTELDGGPIELADASSCSFVNAFPDLDGDGYFAGQWGENGRAICSGEPIPAGFSTLGGDCDDHDAQRSQELCIDRDGDRAVVRECGGSEPSAGGLPCPVIVEWRPGSGLYDCDDADPQRIDYHYRDTDRDGFGAGEPACTRAEPGWSARDGDCDDSDATRTPRNAERFDDGLDSDCDGTDQSPCVPKEPGAYYWPTRRDEPCVGIDLALGYASCAGCAVPQATFVVENRGASAVRAEVLLIGLEQRSEPVQLSFTLELGAGEQRAIASGPFKDKFELRLAPPAQPDCRPEDNRVDVPEGHCI
jgi:hypothetical protein